MKAETLSNSFTLRDNVSINGINTNISDKNNLIGEVTIKKYDSQGNLLYVKRDHNKIVRPGSISVLEHLFKKSASSRYEHNLYVSSKITGFGNIVLSNGWSENPDISKEQVIGFVVGNGGATAAGTNVVKYDSTCLIDENGKQSMIPFRLVSASEAQPEKFIPDPTSTVSGRYLFKGISTSTSPSGSSAYNFYYVKGFESEPVITSDDKESKVTMQFKIEPGEFLEYLQLAPSDVQGINQIGLISGIYDSENEVYDNLRLITTFNCTTMDVTESSAYTITYTVYCK